MHPLNYYEYFRKTGELVILITEGLGIDWPIVSHFRQYTYVFNIVPFNLKKPHLEEFITKWEGGMLPKGLPGAFAPSDPLPLFDFRTNIIWMMNTEQQVAWATELGLTSILVNHNCWLDENIYRITDTEKTSTRQYDAVINARPFIWKRVYLADKIDNLAFIKGYDYTVGGRWGWMPWYRLYSYVNPKPLESTQEIVTILNQSQVGLVLSGSTGTNRQENYEGACYASSEYLLCGLPVVSTCSEGGRDVWYDSNNAIICEPTREAVKAATDKWLKLIHSGEVDRNAIRQQHIGRQKVMRQRFINYTDGLFKRHNIDVNSEQIFKEKFKNKMTNYDVDPKNTILQ